MKNFGRLVSGRLIRSSIFIVFLAVSAVATWAIDPQATDPAAANLATAGTQPTDPAAANLATADSPAPNTQAADNPAADPPGRVARLQYMSGSVSVQPNGTGDWVQGSANRPLSNADNVWADKDSRAELNLGTGFLRINSETSLTLTNINNDAAQVSLHQGTLNVHIRHLYKGEVYEIDTPNLAFTVTKAGEYRFDVDPNGDSTLVTVLKGEGEATGQGPAVRVHAGEQARFTGGNSLAHEMHSAPRPDGFDDWCRVRDEREDHSISARYVAPGTVGAEDLDDNGTWTETPEYGHVWVPSTVEPGWTPYSNGNWIWEDPWGWTWVDYAPWGFAPFHYGRWVAWGGGWGWAPGPYWVRPWYAPALVGWFGGPGWGLGFGWGWGGGFGWCPLGWGEPFYPWFGASRGYFRNVNISNTRITNINRITNNYYNNGGNRYGTRGLPRYASTAGRAISRNTLGRGLPVAANSVKLTPGQLKGASAISRLNASPTQASRLGARATPASARPPASALSRSTVSRMTPPASSRLAAARNTASPVARNGQTPAAHNPGNPVARNAGTSAARTPERTQVNSASAPGARNVPRPPQSLNNSNRGALQARTAGSTAMQNHYVPRPPSAGGSSASGTRPGTGRSEPAQMAMNHSVPRPPANFSNGRTSQPSGNSSARPNYNSPRGASNVPRPSGQVRPAPRDYSSAQSRGGYSGRSYGGYNGGGSSYGRSYGGRGYSTPSYGGRGYSAPSHSSGSYGGSGGGGYHGSSGGGGGYHGGGGGGGGGSHGGGGGGGSGASHGGGGGGGGSHGGHR